MRMASIKNSQNFFVSGINKGNIVSITDLAIEAHGGTSVEDFPLEVNGGYELPIDTIKGTGVPPGATDIPEITISGENPIICDLPDIVTADPGTTYLDNDSGYIYVKTVEGDWVFSGIDYDTLDPIVPKSAVFGSVFGSGAKIVAGVGHPNVDILASQVFVDLFSVTGEELVINPELSDHNAWFARRATTQDHWPLYLDTQTGWLWALNGGPGALSGNKWVLCGVCQGQPAIHLHNNLPNYKLVSPAKGTSGFLVFSSRAKKFSFRLGDTANTASFTIQGEDMSALPAITGVTLDGAPLNPNHSESVYKEAFSITAPAQASSGAITYTFSVSVTARQYFETAVTSGLKERYRLKLQFANGVYVYFYLYVYLVGNLISITPVDIQYGSKETPILTSSGIHAENATCSLDFTKVGYLNSQQNNFQVLNIKGCAGDWFNVVGNRIVTLEKGVSESHVMSLAFTAPSVPGIYCTRLVVLHKASESFRFMTLYAYVNSTTDPLGDDAEVFTQDEGANILGEGTEALYQTLDIPSGTRLYAIFNNPTDTPITIKSIDADGCTVVYPDTVLGSVVQPQSELHILVIYYTKLALSINGAPI